MTRLIDIYGQDAVQKILINSYRRGKTASAYLFYGPDGTGKWNGALALAALLNCIQPRIDERGEVLDACGECLNCRQIGNLVFPEMHFGLPLPPHKNEKEAIDLTLEFLEQKRRDAYHLAVSGRQLSIPVDTARAIKMRCAQKSLPDQKRVVLFYGMDKMLKNSADSLLKLIEEPPPNTVIIMTTRDKSDLLPTIQSRAQKIRFRPLPSPLIAAYLKEKYQVPEDRADLLGRLADGSIGRAVRIMENEDDIDRRQVSFLLFKSLFLADTPSVLSAITELIDDRNRGATEETLGYWQSFLSDLIKIKHSSGTMEISNLDLRKELESLADRLPPPDGLGRLGDEIVAMVMGLKRNIHIRLGMSELALRLRQHLYQSA